MRAYRLLPFAVIALAGLSLGSGCPTVPQIEDREVELALGGSTTQEFVASGEIGVHDDTQSYDLSTLDLAGTLDEAGIDASDVMDVKFSGAQYRVTQIDPAPDRKIENGAVTVKRGLGTEKSLITDFDVDVNSATSWQAAVLDTPGVNVINVVLEDVLTELKTGTPVSNPVVSVHVSGVSTSSDPQNPATNFKYEIRLNISIVGTVKTKVLN